MDRAPSKYKPRDGRRAERKVHATTVSPCGSWTRLTPSASSTPLRRLAAPRSASMTGTDLLSCGNRRAAPPHLRTCAALPNCAVLRSRRYRCAAPLARTFRALRWGRPPGTAGRAPSSRARSMHGVQNSSLTQRRLPRLRSAELDLATQSPGFGALQETVQNRYGNQRC